MNAIVATTAPKRRYLTRRYKWDLRWQAEEAIERLLDLIDQIDGDPDFEPQCEDEGAQCDDEGAQQGI